MQSPYTDRTLKWREEDGLQEVAPTDDVIEVGCNHYIVVSKGGFQQERRYNEMVAVHGQPLARRPPFLKRISPLTKTRMKARY